MRRFYKNLVMLFDLSLYREAILLDIYIKSSTQDCHALPSITQNFQAPSTEIFSSARLTLLLLCFLFGENEQNELMCKHRRKSSRVSLTKEHVTQHLTKLRLRM